MGANPWFNATQRRSPEGGDGWPIDFASICHGGAFGPVGSPVVLLGLCCCWLLFLGFTPEALAFRPVGTMETVRSDSTRSPGLVHDAKLYFKQRKSISRSRKAHRRKQRWAFCDNQSGRLQGNPGHGSSSGRGSAEAVPASSPDGL